ncbi:single-strand DNA endonuclease ASTE1-like [Sebastes fasciatus]|uniref:single-strand DNA endonuclease ASTE1-like n=1 Tax=Sebastes fasciatus TaxID=394691 RepID=UPI003D9E5199
MGVQSLTSLLKNHPNIYKYVPFSGSKLVVDGCNLLYLLYFSSGLDQNHGGEYAAFEVQIEKFIKALRDCGIEPHVVLDGCSDYTDKKLQTLKLKALSRIKKAHQAAEGNSQEGILPQLVKLVFKQTLARLEVPVAQCYWEADQEIAALAREWRCPVLSDDSDFYIFDLPAGLLPLSDFQWEAVEQSGSQSYIPCKSYNTSSFCNFFSIQRQLLPAFAALAGNDYVNLQKMTSPINWAQFAPKGKGVGTTGRLKGLLCWLRAFQQPQEALKAALGLMGDLSRKTKEEVLKGLYLGMKEYQLPPSSLKRFFIQGEAPPLPAVEQVTDLVPDWIRLPLTQARLTDDILDVLLLRRMSLSYPVDHADMPSAHLTSRPLRQVMYGLLLGDGPEVEERDRDGLELRFIPVRPAITDATQQLTLSSLDQAEPSQRLLILLGALGVTEDSLSRLPSQLRLPAAATCYWLQRAQPPPDQEVVNALLLGLSTGDALRHTAALQIQRHRQKLDATVNHALNQWQSCLNVSVQLNQLLGFPLPEPHIARLYEGKLVHQLILRMRSGGKLRPFVKTDRSGVKRYQTMQAVVHQFHTWEALAPSETQERAPQRNPLDDLPATLQQLFLLDEDEDLEASSLVRIEEDLHLNHLV